MGEVALFAQIIFEFHTYIVSYFPRKNKQLLGAKFGFIIMD